MSLTILTGCHRNISAMHNLKKRCFPRRNWRCLSWGVRQKMTARHISLCEAKVPAAAPIFVSGERPPAHIQQLLSPILSPNLSLISHQGQAHTALHIRRWKGWTTITPYRGNNTSIIHSLVPHQGPAHTTQACKKKAPS